MDGFVVKPVDRQQLEAAIRDACAVRERVLAD
jgi:hypothetical protein